MADYSRDIDIGYPTMGIDVVISLLGTVHTAILSSIEVSKKNTMELWEELYTGREWNTVLNANIVDKLERIRLEAGVNVVTQLLTFHSEFDELIATIPSGDLVLAELRALRTGNADIGDMIVQKLQDGQDWNWEMTDQVVQELQSLKLSNRTIGEEIVAGIGELEQPEAAAAHTALVLTELRTLGLSADDIEAILDNTIAELRRMRLTTEFILGQPVEDTD